MGNEQAKQTVEQFMQAINSKDLDRVLNLVTDDIQFENTGPPPDGERYQGKAEMKRFWEQFFANAPQARFEFENILSSGDHVIATHQYYWAENGQGPDPGRVRGVTIFDVRDGKIAGMYPYVKG
jgi:ketosteroid isomerase-like protein